MKPQWLTQIFIWQIILENIIKIIPRITYKDNINYKSADDMIIITYKDNINYKSADDMIMVDPPCNIACHVKFTN